MRCRGTGGRLRLVRRRRRGGGRSVARWRPGRSPAAGPAAELAAYVAELERAGARPRHLETVRWWLEAAWTVTEDDAPEVAELFAEFGREDRAQWLAGLYG